MRATLLIAGMAATVVALLAALGVSSGIFIRRFDNIELEQAAERAAQVSRALEADLNQLALSTRDYAEWDDAQAYALGKEPNFLAANFSVDSLEGMKVDAVAILAADGAEMYSALLDEDDTRLMSPAPRELLDTFRRLQPSQAALRDLTSAQRIVNTGNGLLAFCAVEIRRSDKSGETGAVMFFARFIRADVVRRVRETSRLQAEFVTIGEPGGAAGLPPNVRSWLRGSQGAAPLDSIATGPDKVAGYALVSDMNGRPLAYFVTERSRDIGQLGRHTTWQLMGTLAALTIASACVLLAMMLRLRRSWAERAVLESRHRNILAQLGESVILAEPVSGQIVDANEALLEMVGYARADLTALTLRSIYVDLPDVLEGGAPPTEQRVRSRDGGLHEEEVTVTDVVDDGRRLVCVVGRDISQRKRADQAQTRLAHVIEHDALTELPNRTYLEVRLPALLARLQEQGQQLALLLIDLDHFKKVNDSRGHGQGDAILQTIARRLCAAASDDEVVVRMGGDEFVVIAPGVSAGAAVATLAERLLVAVRQPLELDENLSLTASIGVALHPQDGADGESLLKHADIALHEAKERGRDCWRVFSSDMNAQLIEQLALERALRRALDGDEIYVEYQPVVNLQTGLLVSFEALARWRHPQMGVVSPGRFIPVAEKTGMIVPMTELIVRRVVRQLREWQDAGLLLAPVAVNIAPMQFERTEFPIFVQETALEHAINPRWLSFEVTESAWMQNSNKHIVMIDSLRHEGSRVYIDDFGTGFSNLSYLKTLPVDAVKIDQSFIRGIETDAGDEAIVKGVIAMASQLMLATIAEGIETAAQALRLRELGCQYGQGYYFSRPMAADKCRALLEQLAAAQRVTETLTMRAFRKAAS